MAVLKIKNGDTWQQITTIKGETGATGQDGEDGFSPEVSTSKSGKTTTITIVDSQGTHTATILDGQDGTGTGDMMKSVYDTNNNGIVDSAESVAWSGVTGKPETYPPSSHNHNDLYYGKSDTYTKDEVDTALGGKANTSHTHTKSQITDFAHTHTTSDITGLSIPTKTSDLTNDGDGTNPFLTSHQSLSAYRTSSAQDAIDATKSSKASVLTGTLTVADWSNNTQTLTISGLATSGYAYTLAPASASFTNFAEAQIYADDVTTANQMTFHCETTPTSAINVVILKCEVA